MSDWRAVQTAIPAAVRKITGNRFDVGWGNLEARWRDKAHCRLSVVSRRALGRTEVRRTDNGDGTFTERVYTPATMVVQFTFVSQDQDLYDSALPYAEAVSVALRRSDSFGVLCDAGLGIAEVGTLNVVDFIDEHERWRSSVSFDVTFNTHSSVVTGFGRTTNYIRNVVISNDITGGTFEVPEIVISQIILTEASEPLLAEDGTPLFTEGVSA